MPPPPFSLQPQGSDPGLDRLRARLRVFAVLLMLASLAALPLAVS